MAWIYGIQSGEYIKIGIATRIQDRVQIMRLYNPHPVKVVMRRRILEPRWVERRMHHILAPYGIGREWFKVDVGLVRSTLTVVLRELNEKRTAQILWEAQCLERERNKKTDSINGGRMVDSEQFTNDNNDQISLHTGEVEGSIPSAPTIKPLILLQS